MEIITNEDGTMNTEQSEAMNTIAASLLKGTFQILGELDADALQKADKETGNEILNDVAKQLFNKIAEEDVLPVFIEQLGDASIGIIQSVMYKLKQLQDGVKNGLVAGAMGVEVEDFESITYKEMVAKLSEMQSK